MSRSTISATGEMILLVFIMKYRIYRETLKDSSVYKFWENLKDEDNLRLWNICKGIPELSTFF